VNEEMAWIVQAQQGNDEAFAQLVETYQTPVFNLCYRMLGEPEAAEDAAQESFLRAYQNIGRYDTQRSFATWLLSIAAHYCIDRLRRRRFIPVSIDSEVRLHKVLNSLDATDRAAIVLRYWHDFSEIEIASTLSLTVSAVKSRLHRARKELAKIWMEETPRTRLERSPHESPAF
jgi:RNA polymerase sigma-70 factor (ECF subfamily)